ncbi:transcriptional regulator with XRE-family HTH domain [Salibacterium salarium]|uniref:helix-turn-helix domain-containing protein n=1 Tax=Salibacterium salarium TaxID=284579 RepID=UPI002789FAF2|nr:helix-turn-helix transcriptional regulator [Salibacterium salarium]MDQ0299687.1 transcriptional regulator with XRE-family HTH domain [Salibacterium salarium]
MENTTAKRLEQLRENRGWTKSYVAKDKLGFKGVSTYANWEYGTRSPDHDSILKLADIYDTTTDYILGRSNNPTPPDEDYDPMEDLKQFFIDNDLQDAGFNFYDINEWKKMSREQIQEVKNHWLWVKEKARRMEEEDEE